MDRDAARQIWENSKIDILSLSLENFYQLANFIEEAAKNCDSDLKLYGDVLGGGKSSNVACELRCSSDYFEDREMVTFYKPNANKFHVGFAGWADDETIQPILTGFVKWVEFMSKSETNVEVEVPANKWTNERCEQLQNVLQVLRIVANVNSSNNFIKNITIASDLADSLLNDKYPTFISFLESLAIEDRQKAKQQCNTKNL